MAFLEFISKFKPSNKNKEEEGALSDYKKVIAERDKQRKDLRENLKNMGFNNSEISEVFVVVEAHFAQLEEVKKQLIEAPAGTNLEPIAKKVKEESEGISKRMLTALKAKVAEIRERKGQG